MTILFTFTG